MKKVLVTGGAGFIGSHIADALSESGHDVVVHDLKESPYLRDNQTQILGNLLDQRGLEECLKGVDVVYHLGGLADLDVAYDRPYDALEVNVLGTVNLLEAMVKVGVKRILFASTIYVHSSTGSFYRIAKHCCEQILEEFEERFGVDYTVLRFGTVYGTRSDAHNSVYRYLMSALSEGEIVFHGSGDEVREYIHVRDAAKICVDLIHDASEQRNYIVTGHDRIRVTELLDIIKEIMGNKINIKVLSDDNRSHYNRTPYSYHPKIGKKILSSTYNDLGQSLVEILEEIDPRLPVAAAPVRTISPNSPSRS